MSAEPTLRDVLAAQIEAFGAIGGSNLLGKIILKHGIYGRGVRHSYLRGRMKECFSNAAHRALEGPMHYVEGYAMRKGIGFPIHHAWNIDPDGEIIDVTWDDPWDCEYLGIKFTHDVLLRELLKNEVYGLLAPFEMLNIDLLREIDADVVDEAISSRARLRSRA